MRAIDAMAQRPPHRHRHARAAGRHVPTRGRHPRMASRPLRAVPHVGRGRNAARARAAALDAPPTGPARRTAPGPCLVWGDARLSNLVYRDFDVVAVLDWEMSGIGDPLLDLGWWIFADRALTEGSGCERLEGFPSAEETARRWAGATGRSTDCARLLRAVRRLALHGDHAAHGQAPRRHGARAAGVRVRQPHQPGHGSTVRAHLSGPTDSDPGEGIRPWRGESGAVASRRFSVQCEPKVSEPKRREPSPGAKCPGPIPRERHEPIAVRRHRGGRAVRGFSDGDAARPQGLQRARRRSGHVPERHAVDARASPAGRRAR